MQVPRALTAVILASVAAAAAVHAEPLTPCDLDGDGKHDIVAHTASSMLRAQLFDGAGVTQTGYAVQPRVQACARLGSGARSSLVLHSGGPVLVREMVGPTPLGPADHRTWLDGRGWSFGRLADLDGDEIVDFAMTRFDDLYLRLTGLQRAGTGTILEMQRVYLPVMADGALAGAGDLDGDGRADLVFNAPLGVCIRLNEGPIGAASWPVSFAEPVCIAGAVSFLADLDGDGKQDLVESASDHTRVSLMDGTTVFETAVLGNGGGAHRVRLAADLNADGRDDLIGAVDGGAHVRIDLMDGVTAIGRGYVGTGGGAYLLRQAGDLSGDGRADLLFDGPTVFRAVLMSGTTPTETRWIPNAAGAYDLLDLRSP